MTSRWFGTLLIAATALTPLTAVQAQDGFGAEVMAQGRAAAIAATSGGIHSVDVPASNLRVTPAIPSTDSSEFQRGERGNRGGRGGGGGGNRGDWGSPSASPSPAPAPAPAPQTNGGWRSRGDGNAGGGGGYRARPDNGGNPGGGGYRTRADTEGGGWRQPRAERPATSPAERGNWASRRAEGNRYQPPVATPAPVPTDTGRWQGRGGYRQGDTTSGYTRGTEERRGNGGFGNRVVRNAERANGGNRYDNDRRYDGNRNDGNRYDGRHRDSDRRYDGNRWDRRDNDRYNGTRYGNNRYAGWDRSWRNDRRYDWQSHRTRYNSYYRMPRYYSPYRDWNYRRLSIGFSLWPLFYSERYWINDPWEYRLPDVYGPYRWVRYYDDALLVDVTSGEVVDVIENFFW
jgi:hypothetical protein